MIILYYELFSRTESVDTKKDAQIDATIIVIVGVISILLSIKLPRSKPLNVELSI